MSLCQGNKAKAQGRLETWMIANSENWMFTDLMGVQTNPTNYLFFDLAKVAKGFHSGTSDKCKYLVMMVLWMKVHGRQECRS